MTNRNIIRLSVFIIIVISIPFMSVACNWETSKAGKAGDNTAPTVISTIPYDTAANLSINSAMAATFSEAMDPLTLTSETFTLKQGGTAVSGTVNYAGVTATFKPNVNLALNTRYTVTITTGARDLAGNALAEEKVWTFTSSGTQDVTAPTVISTIPADTATGVDINSALAATFSEAMCALSFPATTFTLKQGTTPVKGKVAYAGLTATFTPDASLAPGTEYTATISTWAKDLAGNSLAAKKVWTFTTGVVK